MATKKEMAKELFELGIGESIQSLVNENTARQLEKMLEDAKTPVTTEVKIEADVSSDNLEDIKKQMMEQLKAEMEEKIRKELEEEIKSSVKPEPTPSVNKRRITQIDRHELIPVMNVQASNLVYVSPRTGMEVRWTEYGDIEYIEMQEIQTMRSSQRKFIDEPFVLILDEDVISYLGLDKMYENLDVAKDIDSIFRMPNDKFKDTVEKLPRGLQMTVVGRAQELVEKGEFDSMQKISYLNEKFNIELSV